ncbi:peroxisome assembly protein (Peroxin-2) [Tulasnella sp. 403]|nr:peroxisome assembly protein (Peroxin-2) [Tulasnella sp. 403]
MSTSHEAFWQRAWNDAQPTLLEVREKLSESRNIDPRNVRVGQLDAELLDQELLALLKQPLSSSLSLAKSTLASRFDLELGLLIQTLLYKFSVWDNGATYGAKLQDLCFERLPRRFGERHAPCGLPQRVLFTHASLTILLPYLHARLRAHALSQSWPDTPRSDTRRKAWEVLVTYETFQATFSLVGFILFLWNGKYRSLLDRALSMKLVPARRVVARNVNYEFMNRQMVWHAFTEFLLFILPLINARILKRRLSRIFHKATTAISLSKDRVFGTSDFSQEAAKEKGKSGLGKYAFLKENTCAICVEDAEDARKSNPMAAANVAISTSDSADSIPSYPITMPYTTSCGHTYCYHCLTDRMMRAADDGEQGWECLRCRSIVSSSARAEAEPGSDSEGGSDGVSERASSIDSNDVPTSLESSRP